MQQKKKDCVQPQVEVEKYDNNKEVNLVLQEYNSIMSFTQLLMADHDNLFFHGSSLDNILYMVVMMMIICSRMELVR